MTRLIRATLLAIALGALTVSTAFGESIQLRSEGGTFVLPVVINDKITLDFTLDSGAADVSIPVDVFSTLQRTQTITKDDLLRSGEYELADGSTHQQARFRIRSLKVGNFELRDVVASVAPARGSLLLGQSFLSRLQSWAIDNQRHVFVINEGAAQTAVNQRSTPNVSNSGSTKETFFKDIHGCLFFNAFPDPGEQMQWEGSCEGGYAHGAGRMQGRSSKDFHYWMQGAMVKGKFEGSVEISGDKGYHNVCNFSAGLCRGHGEVHYTDGSTYEGMFHAGVRTGRGVLTWANGDRYEGDFVAGALEGRGVVNFANGNRYEGQMHAGKLDGRGTLNYPNGSRYEGEFRAGNPEGHGTFFYTDGGRWKGNFVAGKPDGLGTYVAANGDRRESNYVDRNLSAKP